MEDQLAWLWQTARVLRSPNHTEWWIPAEDLEALNDHIVGTIEVIHEFGGA